MIGDSVHVDADQQGEDLNVSDGKNEEVRNILGDDNAHRRESGSGIREVPTEGSSDLTGTSIVRNEKNK